MLKTKNVIKNLKTIHIFLKSVTIQKQAKEVFYKKDALKNFAKFTGKHLYKSLFFNKGCMPKACDVIEKRDSSRDVFLWVLQNFQENISSF